MIKIILILIFLCIIPFFLGKYLNKGKNTDILYTWLFGNFFQMAILFIIAIPMVLFKVKFSIVLKIYLIVIGILTFISIIKNNKEVIFYIKSKKSVKWKEIIRNVSIYQIIFLILISIQIFARFKYTSLNDDDANFVANAATIIQTDKMYLHSMEGVEVNTLEARKALAPLNVYYAIISYELGIHVTIIMHTVMPIVFFIMAYILYYNLSKKLFTNVDSRYIFLIFIIFLFLYSFDIKGYNKYFILYTWFGRAILATLIIPSVWLISFDAMNKEKNKLIDWILIFVLVNSGCLCSEMAVPLISVSLGSLAIVNSIRDKKISYLLKSILCLIPCLIIGILYLKIR